MFIMFMIQFKLTFSKCLQTLKDNYFRKGIKYIAIIVFRLHISFLEVIYYSEVNDVVFALEAL
jgi:hypothetical protein